jgi:hypothetical protein
MECTIAGWQIVGTCFHSNEYDGISNALHTDSHQFLGNIYRGVSVAMDG